MTTATETGTGTETMTATAPATATAIAAPPDTASAAATEATGAPAATHERITEDEPDPLAPEAIWERALVAADQKDGDAIERALDDIRARIAARPDADAHYVHGKILLLLGWDAEARLALDEALSLRPGYAPAHYTYGNLLSKAGRDDEAIEHWEAAVAADAGHVDALYNLGQARYNHGEFEASLLCWDKAQALVPQDLEVRKKVIQAQHALGQYDAAARGIEVLAALYREHPPEAAEPGGAPGDRPLEAVIDQFRVGGKQVYVYRLLTPAVHDMDYVYSFRLVEDTDTHKVLCSVQLESSAYGRERGVPYLLAISTEVTHQLLGPSFTALPPYEELRELAVAALGEALAPG